MHTPCGSCSMLLLQPFQATIKHRRPAAHLIAAGRGGYCCLNAHAVMLFLLPACLTSALLITNSLLVTWSRLRVVLPNAHAMLVLLAADVPCLGKSNTGLLLTWSRLREGLWVVLPDAHAMLLLLLAAHLPGLMHLRLWHVCQLWTPGLHVLAICVIVLCAAAARKLPARKAQLTDDRVAASTAGCQRARWQRTQLVAGDLGSRGLHKERAAQVRAGYTVLAAAAQKPGRQLRVSLRTLDCLVMLNLFTRPPVRPAADTQLPQLEHTS